MLLMARVRLNETKILPYKICNNLYSSKKGLYIQVGDTSHTMEENVIL